MIGKMIAWVRTFLSVLVILPVRCYQAILGPMLPKVCTFEPSCSEYFILAVQKHGPLRGACKGVWRICRCNPWTGGGIDPP